jgi:large subunit ribosomal protein L15
MSLEEILSTDTGRSNNNRVGRGPGSGNGKTCGRGHKGAGSRSGRKRHPLFEGGQMPFWMRLPIRGFSNHRHTTRYQAVKLSRALEQVKGDLSIEAIIAAGLAGKNDRIKLVSGTELKKKINVQVHRVTKSVREVIEKAGGTVEEIDARG